MQYKTLSRTDISVSLICLGTMTWGEQNTEAEAHAQMDYALANGVNFFDTAEMYPVPPMGTTQGRTEEYIGTWFTNTKQRSKVILATKVTGRSQFFTYLGRGETRLNKAHITQALEGNLKRLQTDYIDLYQLHWPERNTNYFGQLGYTHDEAKDNDPLPLLETLEVLAGFVRAGKIRHIGMSNESPWGLMEYLHLAEKHGLPRMISIQNPYSLVNRSFEVGLAECAIREECGLLAYSPLGFGVLSGKYLNGARPEGARLSKYERFQRYNNPRTNAAVEKYVALAKQHGLDPAQMALAYVNTRPFVTSNIIGATTIEQLKSNIASVNVKLSDAVLAGIESIHANNPNPAP